VAFIEQPAPMDSPPSDGKWLMMSDVCKHCTHAGCMEACPTGAIVRNEFDNVYIQPDVCNGCGYCVPSCPFGVVDIIEHADYKADRTFVSDGRSSDDALQARGGIAGKCTLCYDRQKVGFTPACAKACPTESIQFGDVAELKERARERVETLRGRGVDAYLYGVDEAHSVGDLNAFFLLTAQPESYNLPSRPVLPSTHQPAGYASAALAAITLAIVGSVLFRSRT
jgi:formate dehydrogenase iron-sulfur subunit